MKRILVAAVCVLLAVLFGSCGDPKQTAIVIVVRENFGPELEEVRYEFLSAEIDAGAETDAAARPEPVAAVQRGDEVGEPVVLLKGRAREVEVRVTAIDRSGQPLVQNRALVRFIEEEVLQLKVVLATGCIRVSCAPDETCNGETEPDRPAFCDSIVQDQLQEFRGAGELSRWLPRIAEGPPLAPNERDARVPQAEAGGSSDAGVQPDLDGQAAIGDAQTQVDAADPCGRGNGDQCRLADSCGCMEGQICKIPADGGASLCVAPGTKKRNDRCAKDSDCEGNLTCLQNVCRAVCSGAQDCPNGECRPFSADAGAEPSYCLDTCDLGKSCGENVACVPRKGDRDGGGACLVPSDCEGKSDQSCGEPVRGSGMCIEGSDNQDCCPMLRNTTMRCDPVDDCGCGPGSTCEYQPQTQTSCRRVQGDAGAGAVCGANASLCAKGLFCSGLCTGYCRTEADCKKPAVCERFPGDAGLGFGYCRYKCTTAADCESRNCGPMTAAGRFCAPPTMP